MTTDCNEHASSVLKSIFKSADQSRTYSSLRDAFPVEYAEAIQELEREHQAITADPDDIINGVIATSATANPGLAQMVINAPVADDGRSEWLWIRFANGDLILGCYPRAETYEATEADPARP